MLTDEIRKIPLLLFSGMYVLDHHTLPGYTSRFVSVDKDVSFDLDLLWGQNTFDGPHQLWRATSEYSLKVSFICNIKN